MNDFSQSVMIALLPTTTDWCKIDLPHMTLVYCGEMEMLMQGDHNELAKLAITLAMTCSKLTLTVLGVKQFGDDQPVEVLLLRPDPQLIAMRHMVESWNASEHPFNPHTTVGPLGSVVEEEIPDTLTFDRIAVGWGDSLLTYQLQ